MNKAKYIYSEFVSPACAIAFLVVAFASMAGCQTVEQRPGKRGPLAVWNNSEFFETAPKPMALDWTTYMETWDGKQFTTWGAFAIAGILHGSREAYHADPYVFETRWRVGSESWFGSDAWKRNYHGNDPANGHKQEYFGNVGRDVWHTFGFGSNALSWGGVWVISTRKQPVKYRVTNLLLGLGVRSLAASLTYNALR